MSVDGRPWTVRSAPAANVERAGQPHFDGFVRPRDFPRVGPGEPVIRLLVLPAVAHGLLEDAVLVAQAGAHARNAERRHRIEEARRQPAEPAVAETGVGLLLDDFERIDLVLLAELAPDRVEQQVGDVVRQRAAHQEFERQVVDPFRIPRLVGLLGLDPALRQQVADRARDGLELVARRGGGDRDDLIEGQMPFVQRVAVAGERDRAAVEAVEGIGARHQLTLSSTHAHVMTVQRRDGLPQDVRAPAQAARAPSHRAPAESSSAHPAPPTRCGSASVTPSQSGTPVMREQIVRMARWSCSRTSTMRATALPIP